MRGHATGDAGPMVNPSGMSLTRSYVVEGAYLYGHRASENDVHVSVVDSTSAFNVAGGLYYTYSTSKPMGLVSARGHEWGLALSFPMGDKFSLGMTGKYARLTDERSLVPTAPAGATSERRPVQMPCARFSTNAALVRSPISRRS